MTRAYVTREIYPEGLEILTKGVNTIEVWDRDEQIPRDVLLREIANADGVLTLLTERVDEEFLAHAPRCKVVANMAVGYNNIDVEACTRRGVLVTNTPGVLTETTADLAFAIMMAAARYVGAGIDYVKEGRWKTWSPSLFIGRDIHHATLGILGLGRIGHEMAKRGRGFDMNVLYYDVRRRPDLELQYGYQYVDFDTLLRESDFLSVHVDLNPGTHRLIDATALAKMKPTAYLVNAARGPIVDTEALYRALVDGRLGGAALDVTDPEPLPADHPLLKLENVVVVPHIASASLETRTAMAVLAARNLVAALRGEPPPTPVNSEVLTRAPART